MTLLACSNGLPIGCKWIFFLRSQKAHPLVIVGKRAFDALRPFWVKRMKERNVCCYIYHVEMEELKVGFNHMRHKSELRSISHCD
jgi:hypothetical protein